LSIPDATSETLPERDTLAACLADEFQLPAGAFPLDAAAAELHWFEATGIGRKEMKVKWLLD
jgi:hypothetical protein